MCQGLPTNKQTACKAWPWIRCRGHLQAMDTMPRESTYKPWMIKIYFYGRGGGQVASVLAFYFKDLSSNPTDAYSFFPVKFVLEKTPK